MSFPAEEGWKPFVDDTFVSTLGKMYLRDVNDGCEIGVVSDGHLRNLSGVVHGGVIMTLMDRAGGIGSGKNVGVKRPGQAWLV